MARYIDAEKLKSHIKDLPTWWADGGGVYGESMKYPEGMFDCDDIINSIDNQPTADVVEVKHGHFVRNERNIPKMREFHEKGKALSMNEKSIFYTCSECGEWISLSQKYCSECGAKMDGDKK